MSSEILVIGATGNTGKRIVKRLEALGLAVRPAFRESDIPFDWQQPATWPAVLRDIQTAYVTYSPDLAVPSAHGVIAAFVKAAEVAGLRRLVLLSQRNQVNAQACEQLLKDSSLAWTILQPSWFAQNFSEGGFRDSVLAGEVTVPTSGAAEPFVDLEDVADVAVAALTEDGHTGRVYELTGSDLLGWDEAVAHIAQVTGRNLSFRACSTQDFQQILRSVGFPEADAAFGATLVAQILDGRNARLGDGVQRALGREPKSFAQFCREAQAQGCWAAEPVNA